MAFAAQRCVSVPALYSIIREDHLHVAKRFVEQYEWPEAHLKDVWINQAMNLAANYGKMEILLYLSTHPRDLHTNSRILECGIAGISLS